jgi:hypothetical protein
VKIKALKNDRQAKNDFSADFSHQPVSLHADSGNFRLFNHGRILPGIAVSLGLRSSDTKLFECFSSANVQSDCGRYLSLVSTARTQGY